MKKYLIILITALILLSCNNSTTNTDVIVDDSQALYLTSETKSNAHIYVSINKYNENYSAMVIVYNENEDDTRKYDLSNSTVTVNGVELSQGSDPNFFHKSDFLNLVEGDEVTVVIEENGEELLNVSDFVPVSLDSDSVTVSPDPSESVGTPLTSYDFTISTTDDSLMYYYKIELFENIDDAQYTDYYGLISSAKTASITSDKYRNELFDTCDYGDVSISSVSYKYLNTLGFHEYSSMRIDSPVSIVKSNR